MTHPSIDVKASIRDYIGAVALNEADVDRMREIFDLPPRPERELELLIQADASFDTNYVRLIELAEQRATQKEKKTPAPRGHIVLPKDWTYEYRHGGIVQSVRAQRRRLTNEQTWNIVSTLALLILLVGTVSTLLLLEFR